MPPSIRNQIRITGIVQGVGFRPFVWQQAIKLGLVGWVLNDCSGVTIEVQGDRELLDDFCRHLRTQTPTLAKIDSFSRVEIASRDDAQFLIRESNASEFASTPISPDICVCHDCRMEMDDGRDRRYKYPFINCTNCGPRFTIVEDIPYDRPMTTMKSFPMCVRCESEYSDPESRRFHAQPNACGDCGPIIWWADPDKSINGFDVPRQRPDTSDVLEAFEQAIVEGKIVAVKGIGGFHLACDATNESTVNELRNRKGRVDKPFAVMVRDCDQASQFAIVSTRERQLLESRERPIVLLSRLKGTERLARNVAPDTEFVGVMLPYSPLHHLLISQTPLLMTSGNLSEEPIVRTNLEAQQRLSELADCYLLHDREIHMVCDDSVVRSVDDDLLPIRRSRGYAPMPIRLTHAAPSVLAVGGEIKSTFCLTHDDYAYMSQHLGDMGNAETLDAMTRSVDHFIRLFRVEPKALAADLHPDYLSGEWAAAFAKQLGIPAFRIQHHFAHVVSLIAEHGLPPDQKVIGCCFDGTGYGPDGTIWGGEFLIANSKSFDHWAGLEPFPLPGGDASIKRPGRIALSLLWAHQIQWDDQLAPMQSLARNEQSLLRQQLERDLNCIPTSSMGRLFDAVAALTGIRQTVNYEAQAAMEMEALAASVIDDVGRGYSFEFDDASSPRLGVRHLLHAICEDLRNGASRQEISAKFHHAVADAIVHVCKTAHQETGIETVGLTGGVFQNVLLVRLAKQKLRDVGFRVLTHSSVPPNDGGIALGQAVVARNWLIEGQDET